MSELTKALIQFHKDVDKIEKNARANYGKFADLSQRPQHRHPGAAQERDRLVPEPSLKTVWSLPSGTSAANESAALASSSFVRGGTKRRSGESRDVSTSLCHLLHSGHRG